MIQSQEIIERSLYTELMSVALSLGVTLDPDNYQPITTSSEARFKADAEAIKANNLPFVSIFGVANNQSRDRKFTPRITIESEGFYPGDIGLPKTLLEKQVGFGYTATEVPYEAINQYINIRLVANNQKEMRLLHQILFYAIPQRGYIKPWPSEEFLPEGNIYLELFNFFNRQDVDHGILEKVYQFTVYDTLLEVKENISDVPMIADISLLLEKYYEKPISNPDNPEQIIPGETDILVEVSTDNE